MEGFEPSVFVMDLTNLATGEVRKRLPVNAQIAWFRLKYPMGKIAVSVKAGKNESQIATAKVYADAKDSVENYLAEGTVEKFPIKDKPENRCNRMGADFCYWACIEKCWLWFTSGFGCESCFAV